MQLFAMRLFAMQLFRGGKIVTVDPISMPENACRTSAGVLTSGSYGGSYGDPCGSFNQVRAQAERRKIRTTLSQTANIKEIAPSIHIVFCTEGS